jgi:hypothetical protein
MKNIDTENHHANKLALNISTYINHLEEKITKTRGRPTIHPKETESQRNRVRLVIEEASGVHDIYNGKKPTPLPPGNVVYPDGFVDAWHKIVTKEEEDELCISLLRFLQKIVNRITEYEDEETKTWAPEKKSEGCCSQCGLHHEARDFMRATLLHLIDQVEKHDKFIDFLKGNNFLTQQAYDRVKAKNETKKKLIH